MTVPAARGASRAQRARLVEFIPVQRLWLAAALTFASGAQAQVGASVSIFSDDRFRGYSLSDGRPVGIIDISYDDPSGLYGAVSGSVVTSRDDGLEPFGLQLNGGYAKRLSPSLTLDLGLTHWHYSSYASRPRRHYTEAYAGLSGKILSGRISLSPNYLNPGLWTAYGEVNGSVPAGKEFRFTGHVGLLLPFEGRRDYETYRPELDWRLGIARDFGPVTASVAWTGLERGRDLYQERSHHKNALVFGLAYVF